MTKWLLKITKTVRFFSKSLSNGIDPQTPSGSIYKTHLVSRNDSGSQCHLVVVSRVSQQASEGDGVGNAAQVDEKHSGDGLNVETFIEITG